MVEGVSRRESVGRVLAGGTSWVKVLAGAWVRVLAGGTACGRVLAGARAVGGIQNTCIDRETGGEATDRKQLLENNWIWC